MRTRRRRRSGCEPRAPHRPSRKISGEKVAVGTRSFRSDSSAACRDHAKLGGAMNSPPPPEPSGLQQRTFEKACGLGATVLTSSLLRAMPKRSGSLRLATAARTASMLSVGSPIPMKTTDVSDGMPERTTTRLASHACTRISSADKFRTSPMRPVAQNAHAMRQPTCEDMHSVVCARAFCARRPPSGSGGMSTASTCAPSASIVIRSLRVPSFATASWVSSATPRSGMISRESCRWISLPILCRPAVSRSASSCSHSSKGHNPCRSSLHM
mmetsp:Transcript_36860/g.97475  ORF Transcript_36860/g.97475 Transcript_36860/m.97475 type:complete len:270 (+) Transcript_36860:585-1394(+)